MDHTSNGIFYVCGLVWPFGSIEPKLTTMICRPRPSCSTFPEKKKKRPWDMLFMLNSEEWL